jgi:signal transduction histidine kinase
MQSTQKITDEFIGKAAPEVWGEEIFTTKSHCTDKKTDSPRGTGLGLFSSYQILKPYGVTIDVDSEINEGTTFRLKIPANKNLQDESSEE